MGVINGPSFLAYVQQQLVPTLQPGDIVVLDNLAAHKVAGARKAIEKSGSPLVYLPPYSPDFNPIELVFSKLKHLIRSTAPDPRRASGTCSADLSMPSRPAIASITFAIAAIRKRFAEPIRGFQRANPLSHLFQQIGTVAAKLFCGRDHATLPPEDCFASQLEAVQMVEGLEKRLSGKPTEENDSAKIRSLRSMWR